MIQVRLPEGLKAGSERKRTDKKDTKGADFTELVAGRIGGDGREGGVLDNSPGSGLSIICHRVGDLQSWE